MPTRVSRRYLLIGPLLTRKLFFMTLGVANYTTIPGVAGQGWLTIRWYVLCGMIHLTLECPSHIIQVYLQFLIV